MLVENGRMLLPSSIRISWCTIVDWMLEALIRRRGMELV